MEYREIIKTYSPYVYLHPKDKYRPSTVPETLKKLEIWHPDVKGPLLGVGEITPENLLGLNINGEKSVCYDFNSPSLSRFYFKLPSNKPNPLDLITPMYSFITTNNSDYIDITYVFFYQYNGSTACNGLLPFGIHTLDWERCVMRLVKLPENNYKLEEVYYAQHAAGKWYKVDEIEYYGSHPVVYSGWHSHASYIKSGAKIRICCCGNDYCKGDDDFLCKGEPELICNENVPSWNYFTGNSWKKGGVKFPMWRKDWMHTFDQN